LPVAPRPRYTPPQGPVASLRIQPALNDDIHERRVRKLYWALFSRPPDSAGAEYYTHALRHGASFEQVFDQCTASPEFRARQRSRLIDEQVPTFEHFSAAAPRLKLQIVFVTTGGLATIADAAANLLSGLDERHRMSILDGLEAQDDHPLLRHPAVERHAYPGASVFELRRKLPLIAADTEWIALLEDHNVAPAGWLVAADRAMAEAGPLTTALIGPLANLTSVSPWCWANFLGNFAPNWHPISGHAGPLIANLVFRRDLLPDWELPFGAFETVLLPKLARQARVVNDMWADHVQHRSFITATSSNAHNARVVERWRGCPCRAPGRQSPMRSAWRANARLCSPISSPRTRDPPSRLPTRRCGCAGSPGWCVSPTAGACCSVLAAATIAWSETVWNASKGLALPVPTHVSVQGTLVAGEGLEPPTYGL
jgi:hypothetical protein